jgi:hypothetical protein
MRKQKTHTRFQMKDITSRFHTEERNTWDIKLTHKERGLEDIIQIQTTHNTIY